MSDLQKAWDERCKLRAEGDNLWAESRKIFSKGNKIWIDGRELRIEGDLIFINAVIEKHGPEAVIEWAGDGAIVNGEEFTYDMGGKDE